MDKNGAKILELFYRNLAKIPFKNKAGNLRLGEYIPWFHLYKSVILYIMFF